MVVFASTAGVSFQHTQTQLMEDVLDARMVSDQHFEVQTQHERAMLISLEAPCAHGFDKHGKGQHVRHDASRLLLSMSRKSLEADHCWFECMVLFDRLHAVAPQLTTCRSFQLTCAAVFRIIAKARSDGVSFCLDRVTEVNDKMRTIATTEEGYSEIVAKEPAGQDLEDRERDIFTALDGRLVGPNSPLAWLSNIVIRCSIISEGVLSEQLRSVWKTARDDITAAVMRRSVCVTFAPRRIASGCFLLGMVKIGLLPLDVLRPPAMPELEWTTFCARLGFRASASNSDESVLPGSQLPHLVDVVQAAACCGLQELQHDLLSIFPSEQPVQ
mmetsp:Transcript_9037/g.19969  ORF Transcript_9037/g.19969 Transcript_9037/m.19969 type:complete len:329 (-) Transcript_9037:64-1050(-)